MKVVLILFVVALATVCYSCEEHRRANEIRRQRERAWLEQQKLRQDLEDQKARELAIQRVRNSVLSSSSYPAPFRSYTRRTTTPIRRSYQVNTQGSCDEIGVNPCPSGSRCVYEGGNQVKCLQETTYTINNMKPSPYTSRNNRPYYQRTTISRRPQYVSSNYNGYYPRRVSAQRSIYSIRRDDDCRKGFKKVMPESEDTPTATCRDINECELNATICGPHTRRCYNRVGSYRCICNTGFKERNGTCQDIDECQGATECQQTCINTIGSYNCSCRSGYQELYKGKCIDENECLLDDTCEDGQICMNMNGGYECYEPPTCPENYIRSKPKYPCTYDYQTAGPLAEGKPYSIGYSRFPVPRDYTGLVSNIRIFAQNRKYMHSYTLNVLEQSEKLKVSGRTIGSFYKIIVTTKVGMEADEVQTINLQVIDNVIAQGIKTIYDMTIEVLGYVP